MPIAAVAHQAGVPLTMETVQLDGPRAGLLPLQRTNEAFDLMHRGESIQTVVTLLGSQSRTRVRCSKRNMECGTKECIGHGVAVKVNGSAELTDPALVRA